MLVEVKPISWPGVNSLVARFVTRGAQTTPEPTTGVYCIKCTLNKADIVWHEQQEEPESLGQMIWSILSFNSYVTGYIMFL